MSYAGFNLYDIYPMTITVKFDTLVTNDYINVPWDVYNMHWIFRGSGGFSIMLIPWNIEWILRHPEVDIDHFINLNGENIPIDDLISTNGLVISDKDIAPGRIPQCNKTIH